MEQWKQSGPEVLSARSVPQREVEQACFHALSLISRNCEYLEQHLARSGADPESRQAVNDIGAAGAQLERTLNEVLSLLEYLRQDEPPCPEPVDLCGLLRQLASQADIIRAQLKVELELDCGGWTECQVMGWRSEAELVLLHLLSNALRACDEGGRVQILLRRGETDWQLTVEDDGCGLPDGSETGWMENRRHFLGGAKLGLPLCRECCRRMGWDLQLTGAARGTKAVLTIPPENGAASQAQQLHSGSGVAQEQKKYQLRAMLVRELRTMPERGDPNEL